MNKNKVLVVIKFDNNTKDYWKGLIDNTTMTSYEYTSFSEDSIKVVCDEFVSGKYSIGIKNYDETNFIFIDNKDIDYLSVHSYEGGE